MPPNFQRCRSIVCPTSVRTVSQCASANFDNGAPKSDIHRADRAAVSHRLEEWKQCRRLFSIRSLRTAGGRPGSRNHSRHTRRGHGESRTRKRSSCPRGGTMLSSASTPAVEARELLALTRDRLRSRPRPRSNQSVAPKPSAWTVAGGTAWPSHRDGADERPT